MHAHPVLPGPPIWLPMLSMPVSAGFPSPADDHMDPPIDLRGALIDNEPASFIMRVKGDSALDEGLVEGCLIIVDRSLVPQDGDLVVVDVNGERSVKVWRLRGGHPTLVYGNRLYPAFDPGPEPEVVIFGVVLNSMRRHRR